jgi:ribosome-associated protein
VANGGLPSRFYCFAKRGVGLAKKKKLTARGFAIAAAKVAAERHCTNITILDLRGKSPATDFFVIATGTSDRQMRTVADEISEAGRNSSFMRFGSAGYEQSKWILLDFIDVVVHIFDNEYRNYYDLDLLWGDAKRIPVKYKAAENKQTEST